MTVTLTVTLLIHARLKIRGMVNLTVKLYYITYRYNNVRNCRHATAVCTHTSNRSAYTIRSEVAVVIIVPFVFVVVVQFSIQYKHVLSSLSLGKKGRDPPHVGVPPHKARAF